MSCERKKRAPQISSRHFKDQIINVLGEIMTCEFSFIIHNSHLVIHTIIMIAYKSQK